MQLMNVPTSASIATRCNECSRLFRDLCNILQKAPAESRFRDQIPDSIFFDEVGRFQVWQGNVGAHRSGRISLDYRLREATHMRASVLDLLQDLKDNIEESIQILSGQRLPYDEASSDSDSSESGPDQQLLPSMPRTELQQTMGDIHEIVSSLNEISLTIRNAAPRDRLLKSAAIDVSHFEEWDQRHIEHKYPQADPKLLHRLAHANCKRRQHFKYLEKHHYKLALGIDAYVPLEVPQHNTEDAVKDRHDRRVVEIGPKSITPSMPTTIATKNTQTTVATYRENDEEVFVDDSLSETSSAASGGVSDGSELQIPAPPKSALDGEPFVCPYCFEMMKVSSSLAWRMHVLRDLQPYTCTVNGCAQSHKTYGSRHDWFEHEVQHRKEWSCTYCRQSLSSETNLKSHLDQEHPKLFAPHQLPALTDMCARSVDKSLLDQCPLCLKEGQQLRSHLARHLRTLALFVLPKIHDNKLDDDASNGVQFGGSEEQEDIEAQLDTLTDSDIISDISEEAMAYVPEVESLVRSSALIVTAETAEDVASAVYRFLQYIPEFSKEITATISELYAISSDLRKLSTAIEDPRHRQFNLHVHADIKVTMRSLNYMFVNAHRLFDHFDIGNHDSPKSAHRNAWTNLTIDSRGRTDNLLPRRLEQCRKFLDLLICAIIERRPPDPYEYEDLKGSLDELFKIQDDLGGDIIHKSLPRTLSGVDIMDKGYPPAKASELTAEEDTRQAVPDPYLHSTVKENQKHLMKPLPAFLQLSKEEIAEKFKELNELDRKRLESKQPGPDYQKSMQSLQAVQARNRDMNFYPWDNNRVRLEVPAGSCDYINASPIILRSPSTGEVRRYIATQGPTELSHIWRIVVQETRTTAIIIMLSGLYEGVRHASVQYFPYEMSDHRKKHFDSDVGDNFEFTLTLQDPVFGSLAKAGLRVMELEVEQKITEHMATNDPKADRMRSVPQIIRNIRHYWFGRDNDMAERQAFVELCKSTRNDEISYGAAPRIVHCRTGSGRTGTFIALDFLLGEIENGTMENADAKTDMIFEVVDMLRKQRILMVTSLEQYELLYRFMKEELSEKLTEDARITSFFPITASVKYIIPIGVKEFRYAVHWRSVGGHSHYILRTYQDFYDVQQAFMLSLGSQVERWETSQYGHIPRLGRPESLTGINVRKSTLDDWLTKVLDLYPPGYPSTPSFEAVQKFFRSQEGDLIDHNRSAHPEITQDAPEEGDKTEDRTKNSEGFTIARFGSYVSPHLLSNSSSSETQQVALPKQQNKGGHIIVKGDASIDEMKAAKSSAPEDYRMQLDLLVRQNKNRLRRARQEQDLQEHSQWLAN